MHSLSDLEGRESARTKLYNIVPGVLLEAWKSPHEVSSSSVLLRHILKSYSSKLSHIKNGCVPGQKSWVFLGKTYKVYKLLSCSPLLKKKHFPCTKCSSKIYVIWTPSIFELSQRIMEAREWCGERTREKEKENVPVFNLEGKWISDHISLISLFSFKLQCVLVYWALEMGISNMSRSTIQKVENVSKTLNFTPICWQFCS